MEPSKVCFIYVNMYKNAESCLKVKKLHWNPQVKTSAYQLVGEDGGGMGQMVWETQERLAMTDFSYCLLCAVLGILVFNYCPTTQAAFQTIFPVSCCKFSSVFVVCCFSSSDFYQKNDSHFPILHLILPNVCRFPSASCIYFNAAY